MTDFLDTYQLTGIAIGLCAFLIIGFFHPLVIKGEYHFGTRCWIAFCLVGIGSLFGALFVQHIFWSALLAIIGFSSFWSILEIFEQKKRVEKGWFPANPKRKYNFKEKITKD